MAKPYRSKAIRNIKSAANNTLRTTGNIASKGVIKTAKCLVTDHTGSTQRIGIMELKQRINYSLARMALVNRRMKRSNEQVQRLINTGLNDSAFEGASDWLIDHALYVFDLLWGYIWPIVSYLLWSIFIIVAIVVCNVIFFYALFWFLFS
jgi:hypothetical protein